MKKFVYTILTEDAEILGAADNWDTAFRFCADYAVGSDAFVNAFNMRENTPPEFGGNPNRTWSVPVLVSDSERELFLLHIEETPFFGKGTTFANDLDPNQIYDRNMVQGVIDTHEIPRYLRRQAD